MAELQRRKQKGETTRDLISIDINGKGCGIFLIGGFHDFSFILHSHSWAPQNRQ